MLKGMNLFWHLRLFWTQFLAGYLFLYTNWNSTDIRVACIWKTERKVEIHLLPWRKAGSRWAEMIRKQKWGCVSGTLMGTSFLAYSAHSFIHSANLYSVPAAASKSLQSCPTLCNPIDGSPPGSPVPGILQARTLEWVAISFCNSWMWKAKVKSLSRVQLLAAPWTAGYQAPPSMGLCRQESWSGVPLPTTI